MADSRVELEVVHRDAALGLEVADRYHDLLADVFAQVNLVREPRASLGAAVGRDRDERGVLELLLARDRLLHHLHRHGAHGGGLAGHLERQRVLLHLGLHDHRTLDRRVVLRRRVACRAVLRARPETLLDRLRVRRALAHDVGSRRGARLLLQLLVAVARVAAVSSELKRCLALEVVVGAERVARQLLGAEFEDAGDVLLGPAADLARARVLGGEELARQRRHLLAGVRDLERVLGHRAGTIVLVGALLVGPAREVHGAEAPSRHVRVLVVALAVLIGVVGRIFRARVQRRAALRVQVRRLLVHQVTVLGRRRGAAAEAITVLVVVRVVRALVILATARRLRAHVEVLLRVVRGHAFLEMARVGVTNAVVEAVLVHVQ